jgi:hypothetical protein
MPKQANSTKEDTEEIVVQPAQEKAAAAAPSYLTLRAVLFLVWLIGANDLLTRHLGIGWDEPRLTLALAALGAGFGLLEALTGDDLKKKWLGKLTARLLQTPVILGAYLALILAMLVLSSVTVLNETPDGAVAAALTPVNQRGSKRTADNSSDPKQAVRFLRVWTTPLGRPYRLDVKGYLSHTVQVYPFLGVTVSPRQDLRVSPGLLLRPPVGALGPMTGGVRMAVCAQQNGKWVALADGKVRNSSVLVGMEQSIPPLLLESWRLEAMSQGVTDGEVLAGVLQAWKSPILLESKEPLQPGGLVLATVYDPGGKPLAQARSRLSEERFQDVAMEIVTSSRESCP